MVSLPDFSLMDSMAALQLMDPRMDSGIFPIPLHLIASCDRVADGQHAPPFDPNACFSIADICWIMDRLWACELEWHKGASLSQTIHTCLFIHSLASIDPTSLISGATTLSEWVVTRVLRPFLIAVLKSVGMVWDEMSKGNLIDGEDFNGDKAGISLLEEVSPIDAIHLLQEAMGSVLQEEERGTIDARECNSLLSRMQLRKSFLECVLIFAKVDPTLRLGQDLVPMHVLEDLSPAVDSARRSLESLEADDDATDLDYYPFYSPSFLASPSSQAISAFDPWFSRKPSLQDSYNAPSAPPPPLPLELRPAKNSIRSIRQLLAGFLEARDIVDEHASWSKWKVSLSRSPIVGCNILTKSCSLS